MKNQSEESIKGCYIKWFRWKFETFNVINYAQLDAMLGQSKKFEILKFKIVTKL